MRGARIVIRNVCMRANTIWLQMLDANDLPCYALQELLNNISYYIQKICRPTLHVLQ